MQVWSPLLVFPSLQQHCFSRCRFDCLLSFLSSAVCSSRVSLASMDVVCAAGSPSCVDEVAQAPSGCSRVKERMASCRRASVSASAASTAAARAESATSVSATAHVTGAQQQQQQLGRASIDFVPFPPAAASESSSVAWQLSIFLRCERRRVSQSRVRERAVRVRMGSKSGCSLRPD